VNDSATPEAAPPRTDLGALPAERRSLRVEPRPSPETEAHLTAIEAEAAKWLGGRHSLITRHVAALRKLV